MRCPKCKYEPTSEEQSSSKGQCPSCGIFYEKYIAQLKAKLNGDPPVDIPAPAKVWRHKPASAVIGDSQPVVVVDIQMRFWSMVVFMVKWAFAAIPALIIIGVIITVLSGFFAGVVMSSFSGGSNKSASTQSAPAQVVPASTAPVAVKKAPDKSLSDLLDEVARAKEKVESQEKALTLDNIIWAEITGKSSEPIYISGEGNKIAIDIIYRNYSNKKISKFDGFVTITALKGGDLLEFAVSVAGEIPSDDSSFRRGNLVSYRNTYDRFLNTPINDLKAKLTLQRVLFSDGTILKI